MVKFVHLHSSIRTFFERAGRKIFLTLLGYIVAKVCASPRNLTWFTRPFLLVRGWGLGTRLTVKFVHLHSSIRTFFERAGCKIFLTLLGYIVAKVCTSPRNSTWLTRPFLLVRGWGLGTRLTKLVQTRYMWISDRVCYRLS